MSKKLYDPREDVLRTDGVGRYLESDKRDETMYKWGSMILDLCDLPISEYMKPIQVEVISPEKKDAHEYVDLGLPSGALWAKCNIGAETPYEPGKYFAWGEISGYTADTTQDPPTFSDRSFDWASYEFGEFNSEDPHKGMTKYPLPTDLQVLQDEDDAAHVIWGSDWVMPTSEQFSELINSAYTTTAWTEENGVMGFKVTSKSNGNSIFFFAGGFADEGQVNYFGSYGYYWSSSLGGQYDAYAYELNFGDGYCDVYYGNRCYGFPVRPVAAQNN